VTGSVDTPPSERKRKARERGASSLVGEVLDNRYEVLERIGEGGMGVVFKARQLGVDRLVAIKVLHAELTSRDTLVKRFENEARAVSQLRHPNTIRLYDWQRGDDGHVFIVTELLTGVPLARVLADERRLEAERALRIIDAICRSLSEAHSAGIIHRDLKPENVFIDHIGNDDVIKVLDFGLAKFEGGQVATLPGRVSGTPLYMSPEQISGKPCDGRTDVYALGVVLYEMLTGATPFAAQSAVLIFEGHMYNAPPTFAERAPDLTVPPELEALVREMLAKNPDERPQNVEEVRGRVASLLTTLSAQPKSEAAPWHPLTADIVRRDEVPTETDHPLSIEAPVEMSVAAPKVEPAPVSKQILALSVVLLILSAVALVVALRSFVAATKEEPQDLPFEAVPIESPESPRPITAEPPKAEPSVEHKEPQKIEAPVRQLPRKAAPAPRPERAPGPERKLLPVDLD
jgi:serine/threonine protein kinase